MEEAIVDVALDLNLHPSEQAPREDIQQDMRTDHRDQAQLLIRVPQVGQAPSVSGTNGKQQPGSLSPEKKEKPGSRPQDRAARVAALRECVAKGAYVIDSADLARCILRNATRFRETC